jgi:hypothetical protein
VGAALAPTGTTFTTHSNPTARSSRRKGYGTPLRAAPSEAYVPRDVLTEVNDNDRPDIGDPIDAGDFDADEGVDLG